MPLPRHIKNVSSRLKMMMMMMMMMVVVVVMG